MERSSTKRLCCRPARLRHIDGGSPTGSADRIMHDLADQFPVSVKGILITSGRVLLLLNARGEWDLPGGRAEPGEDHRAALEREVREETGLAIEVGVRSDEHMFEVLPNRFVRIVAFACRLLSDPEVTLSGEHLASCWLPLAELGEHVAGHKLPTGYCAAITTLAAAGAP
jgi:8-oxo-dGTP diphosphatase